MTTITFNATRLAAVALHQSDEATRYYLRGVCFEPCGVAVATDGHTMTAATGGPGYAPDVFASSSTVWMGGVHANGIIVPIDKATLSALKKKGAETFTYDPPAATVRVLDEQGNVTFTKEDVRAIDGTFPDWRRVVPDMAEGDAAPGACFGADIVKRIAETAAVLDKNCGIHIVGRGPADANIVRYTSTEHGASVFSVIVPRRDSFDGPPRPEWLSGNSADQEAAA